MNIHYTHLEYSTYIVFKAAFKVCLHYIRTNQHALSKKPSPYTTLIHLYVCINSLTSADFLETHLRAFIKLVDPIRKQKERAALLREGSWELRVASGWQGSVLTDMGTVPLYSNWESRADPVGVIRVSWEPRHPQTNLQWPDRLRRRQQEKPVGSGWGQEGQDWARVRLQVAQVRSWGRGWAGMGSWAKGLRVPGWAPDEGAIPKHSVFTEFYGFSSHFLTTLVCISSSFTALISLYLAMSGAFNCAPVSSLIIPQTHNNNLNLSIWNLICLALPLFLPSSCLTKWSEGSEDKS